MSGYGFALGVSALLVATLFWLLRARRLREKYSAIWLVLVLGVCLQLAVDLVLPPDDLYSLEPVE